MLEEKETIKEEIDCGLDISTSITGVCFLEKKSGRLLALDFIKLNTSKLDNLWKKADFASSALPGLCAKHGIDPSQVKRIFVEENAKRFSEGYSSADTILTLSKINGIISYLAHCLFKNAQVIDVNVSSARSKLGLKIDRKDKTLSMKEKVFLANVVLHPEFPWPKHIAKTGGHVGEEVYGVEARDMNDAYVIARGGAIIQSLLLG